MRQHRHAERRRRRQHERDRDDAERDQPGEVPPAHARDEQRGEEDRDVDEAGAEIGGHHEHRRDHPDDHQARRRVALAQAPRAVHHEARERDDQQHLAELGGLHLEERQLDRAPRATRHATEDRDEQQAAHHQAVDPVLQLPQARVVDPAQDDRQQRADGEEHALARYVVVRIARNVFARGCVEGNERGGHEADRRQREQRIERQAQARGQPARSPARSSRLVLARRAGHVGAVVELRQHAAGDRRRAGGAEAALLDGRDDDDRPLRVAARRRRTRTGPALAPRSAVPVLP